MFGWWKKNDGFEWREYVRTTILLKRKQRKERVVAVKDKAVAGAKRAGQQGAAAGASGVSAAGTAAASGLAAAGRGLTALLAAIGAGPRRLGAAIAPAFAAVQWRLKPLARHVLAPSIRTPLRIVGFVAAIVALAWLPTRGLVRDTWLAAGVGGAALGLLALARLIAGERFLPRGWTAKVPGLDWVLARVPSISPKVIGGAVAAVLLALGGTMGWNAWRTGSFKAPGLAGLQIPGMGSEIKIEGRASAIDGDTLRINGRIVQLTGIEAPDREQRCARPGNKTWKCGDSARQALTRLVASNRVVCRVSGSARTGHDLGVCEAGGTDLAEALVRRGHVFAASGLFQRYGTAEIAAREAKAGLWRGSAERPQAWRDKLWQDAKRTAPDGCPIKGLVSSEGKTYVLPWSPRYERAKIRSGRGERWFCSEQEAKDAGWKPTLRS